MIGVSQNWADSLTKFERKDSRKSYGWFDSLTIANQTKHILEWYSLKIKTSIDERVAQLADSTNYSNNQIMQRQAYIRHLQSKGYAGDNRKTDWRKAYNKPEIFGANHQSKADQAWEASRVINGGKGLDDFIIFCQQYNY